jgi:hypothetical protein
MTVPENSPLVSRTLSEPVLMYPSNPGANAAED